jgi:hypothetical protein
MKALIATVLALAAGHAGAQQVLRCNMNHPGGDREVSSISVTYSGQITGFSWDLSTKRKGSCSIQAATFNVLGEDRFIGKNGCQLMTWRQGSKLTLAFSPSTPSCNAYCTSQNAFDTLLPMAFDTNGRGCAG